MSHDWSQGDLNAYVALLRGATITGMELRNEYEEDWPVMLVTLRNGESVALYICCDWEGNRPGALSVDSGEEDLRDYSPATPSE